MPAPGGTLLRQGDDGALGLGVVVYRPRPTGHQLHCGIVYRDVRGALQFLHLAWHHQLTNEPLGQRTWVAVQVEPVLVPTYTALCEMMAENPPLIPYGFGRHGGQISALGKYIPGAPDHGLTCATFVLKLLRAYRLDLLQEASWPTRREDAAWHQEILAALAAGSADPDHVEAVRTQVGCARFRPDEVAASAASPPYPADFPSVTPVAQQIRTELGVP
jgi:hypothetical protein